MACDPWQAYEEAAPYLSDMEWVKFILRKVVGEAKDLAGVKAAIERLMSEERDQTRKNDLRILITYMSGQKIRS